MAEFVTIVNTGKHATIHLRARAAIVEQVARDLAMPTPAWSAAGGGYSFPRARLVDVVAALEYAGYRVRVTDRRRRDKPAEGDAE